MINQAFPCTRIQHNLQPGNFCGCVCHSFLLNSRLLLTVMLLLIAACSDSGSSSSGAINNDMINTGDTGGQPDTSPDNMFASESTDDQDDSQAMMTETEPSAPDSNADASEMSANNSGGNTDNSACEICQQATTGFVTYGWPEINVDTSPAAFSIGIFETAPLPAILPDYTGDGLAEIFADSANIVPGRTDLSTLDGQQAFSPDARLIPLTVLDFTADGIPDRVSRNLPRSDTDGTPFSGFEMRFTPGNTNETYIEPDGSNGVRILGIEPGHIGTRTAIGDINGDGFEDLAINPAGVVSASGRAVHILFGRSNFPQGEYQISQLIPDFAQRIFLPDDLRVFSVRGLGDVNGDGFNDFVINTNSQPGSGTQRSNAYIIYGDPSGVLGGPEIMDVESATQTGAASTLTDIQLTNSVGDIDADGVNDFVTSFNSTRPLQLLRMHDIPPGSSLNIDDLADWITRINSPIALQARSAGDIDADGFDDMILSEQAGAIVYGGALAGVAEIDVANLPTSHVRLISSNTPMVTGTVTGSNSVFVGYSLDQPVGGGDINGDGFDDLVIKAPRYRRDDVGEPDPGMNPTQLGADIIVLIGSPR